MPAGRRGARYRCAMVFVREADDPAPIVTEASWEGEIGFERRGTGGFGYDPLFIVAGVDDHGRGDARRGQESREPSRAGAGGACGEA